MSVRFRIDLGVGMSLFEAQFERRHERHPFFHTGREIPDVKLIKPLAGATGFHFVTFFLTDPLQNEATRIIGGAGADRSTLPAVMPRNADGDMVQGEAPGAGGKRSHGISS